MWRRKALLLTSRLRAKSQIWAEHKKSALAILRADVIRGTTSVHWYFTASALTGTSDVSSLIRLYPSALSGAPVVSYSPRIDPCVMIDRMNLTWFSVRSSRMYSPKVTMRLSPTGNSLFSLLVVTGSLHSLKYQTDGFILAKDNFLVKKIFILYQIKVHLWSQRKGHGWQLDKKCKITC